MNRGSLIAYIKTNGVYPNIAEDVETKFETTNYELNRPLPKGKDKKVVNVMTNELGGKTIKEFDRLGAKGYSYLINYDSEEQNARDAKQSKIMKIV